MVLSPAKYEQDYLRGRDRTTLSKDDHIELFRSVQDSLRYDFEENKKLIDMYLDWCRKSLLAIEGDSHAIEKYKRIKKNLDCIEASIDYIEFLGSHEYQYDYRKYVKLYLKAFEDIGVAIESLKDCCENLIDYVVKLDCK